MKVALGVLLAIGCGSSSSGGGAGSERPTVADPIGYCARARGVLQRRKRCFAEDASLTMSIAELAELERGAPADPAARRRVAVECAVRLDSMARVPQPDNCPLDATDAELVELSAFLAAWYGERTPAPTTGDAGTDTALLALAHQRDAACACKKLACLSTASAGLVDEIAALPTATPKVALDAAAAISDQVARCKQRLVYGAPR